MYLIEKNQQKSNLTDKGSSCMSLKAISNEVYGKDRSTQEAEKLLSDPRPRKAETGLKEEDVVNRPSHYQVISGIEAIDLIASSLTLEQWRGYCLGNIMKYRLRCGKKDDIAQEIAKSDKYKKLFKTHRHLCRQEAI